MDTDTDTDTDSDSCQSSDNDNSIINSIINSSDHEDMFDGNDDDGKYVSYCITLVLVLVLLLYMVIVIVIVIVGIYEKIDSGEKMERKWRGNGGEIYVCLDGRIYV